SADTTGNLSVVGMVTATSGFRFSNGSILSGTSVGGDLAGSLPNPTIRNGAITEGKLANLVISTDKLRDQSVTSSKIADGAFTSSKLADGSITDAKIANVGWSKIFGAPLSYPPSGLAGGHLKGAYPSPLIADNAVGALQLSTDGGSLSKVSGGLMNK